MIGIPASVPPMIDPNLLTAHDMKITTSAVAVILVANISNDMLLKTDASTAVPLGDLKSV